MDCCNKNNQKFQKNEASKKRKGVLSGLIYGLIPHIGCIGFIIFSVLGVTVATATFRPLLLNRYFFHILILISFIFATISALIYLKKNGIFSFSGIKRKKGYLLTLYGTTIGINLLLFMLIFPIMANVGPGINFTTAISSAFSSQKNIQIEGEENLLSIKVDIPCPGHAPLITGELRKISGIGDIRYRFPNSFDISYNREKTSKQEMLSLDVFNIYKATVIEEKQGSGGAQSVNILRKTTGQLLGQTDLEDFIQIPLFEVTNQAKWYKYDLGGKEIKFFTVKTEDGSIKTAFDACDVCYYSGKGYQQEGDYMVCNNCGNRYPISGLGTENRTPGGCWPGHLSNIVEGDYILIRKKDLIDNSWRTL